MKATSWACDSCWMKACWRISRKAMRTWQRAWHLGSDPRDPRDPGIQAAVCCRHCPQQLPGPRLKAVWRNYSPMIFPSPLLVQRNLCASEFSDMWTKTWLCCTHPLNQLEAAWTCQFVSICAFLHCQGNFRGRLFPPTAKLCYGVFSPD